MPLNSVRVFILLIALAISLCLCGNSIAMANTLGGIKESSCGAENSVQIDELARFAVEEHNKKENAILEFVRVLHAKEQVVAGTLHHLTLEAIDAGKKKVYDAKIYVKPWLGVKELQEFTHKSDSTSFTSSDLGANREGHAPGWREVPVHDPVIKDAANQAVSSIQQRSNSLVPYELVDIVHAKADVADDLAKFNLVLKLKRGDKEEKFNVEVHKSVEGNFVLNQMKHEHEE